MKYTSTGAIVTINWSRRGNWAERKTRWGTRAARRWKCRKLDENTWDVPRSVPASTIEESFQEIAVASDRAIVIFPHGQNREGAASMSVWTFNCRP